MTLKKQRNNASKQKDRNDTIDLHGLKYNEALEKLKYECNKLIDQSNYKLEVIVGQGHNSKLGPVLKGAVENFAINNHIQYKEDRNPGRIHLDTTDSLFARKPITLSDYPIIKKKRKSNRKRNSLCESPKIESLKLNPSMPTYADIVRGGRTTATTETKKSTRIRV